MREGTKGATRACRQMTKSPDQESSHGRGKTRKRGGMQTGKEGVTAGDSGAKETAMEVEGARSACREGVGAARR